jgi:hypothetical protein
MKRNLSGQAAKIMRKRLFLRRCRKIKITQHALVGSRHFAKLGHAWTFLAIFPCLHFFWLGLQAGRRFLNGQASGRPRPYQDGASLCALTKKSLALTSRE